MTQNPIKSRKFSCYPAKLCRNDVPFLKCGRFPTHSLAKIHAGRRIQFIYDFSYVKTVLRTENLVVIRQKLCRNDIPFLNYGRFSTHYPAKNHARRRTFNKQENLST